MSIEEQSKSTLKQVKNLLTEIELRIGMLSSYQNELVDVDSKELKDLMRTAKSSKGHLFDFLSHSVGILNGRGEQNG